MERRKRKVSGRRKRILGIRRVISESTGEGEGEAEQEKINRGSRKSMYPSLLVPSMEVEERERSLSMTSTTTILGAREASVVVADVTRKRTTRHSRVETTMTRNLTTAIELPAQGVKAVEHVLGTVAAVAVARNLGGEESPLLRILTSRLNIIRCSKLLRLRLGLLLLRCVTLFHSLSVTHANLHLGLALP